MTPPFNHSRHKATEASTTAAVESPDGRLRVFVALISLPLLAIFLRIAELGTNRDGLLQATNAAVRSVLEPMPARDGRIISSDGRILAEDVETFSLLVHYRWFERPADPAWLRGEALRSLRQPERRDRALVLAAEEIALARREALWASLVEITGLSIEELQRRFADRQNALVELRRTVEARRTASLSSQDAPETDRPAATWWEAAGRHVWRAVTTSPRPIVEEPLVLAEELDYHEIATGLPLAVAADIESLPERFPGTRVRVSSRRRYPLGSTASHVIGYRFDDAEALGASESATTSVGQSGVERSYDRHLRGIAGLRRVWLDRRGETIRTAIEREPRVGRDLVLNIDAGLQTEVEHLLDEAIAGVRKAAEPAVPDTAGGCVVVLDLRSGAILASASAPRFDLALAADRDPELWKQALSDKAMPLFNRVTSAALPPGSVFKTVTAAALLDSRRIDPDAPFDCVGYLDRKDRHRDYIYRHFGVGHGPTTLTSALAESCNVYFFHSARVLGATPLISWADRFGYGQRTGIDVPGEATGHLPQDARRTDALGLSIGQADLTATPLQVVRSIAALANGGRLVTPHVVRGSGPVRETQKQVRPSLRVEKVEELQPEMLTRIREGLERVVSHPRGSGYKTVRHPTIAIAGKTGTAEVGGDKPDHAWFAGYAPAGDPRIAFVVLLEHAGSGGQAAGPVARATIDALLRRGFLR